MRSHEMAKQLEAAAKLLRLLPDVELLEILPGLLAVTGAGTKKRGSKHQKTSPISAELLTRLPTMTAAEIQKLLGNEEFASSTVLRQLATKLGIPLSQRQGHAALVNTIARHIENQQM